MLKRLALFMRHAVQKVRARHLSLSLVFLSITMGFATYWALVQQNLQALHPKSIQLIFNIDLGILSLAFIMVARHLSHLWRMHRRGTAGAILHTRLVVLFSILTVLPAIIMGLLMAFFFHAGVTTWFDDKVKTALSESRAVADAYLAEHKKVIRTTTDAMARTIDRVLTFNEQQRQKMGFSLSNDQLPISSDQFHELVDEQARMRGLTEALVFNKSAQVLARSKLTFALEFQTVTPDDLRQSISGVVIQMSPDETRVRALTVIDEDRDLYLLVGRPLDPHILKKITQIKEAVDAYADLESGLGDLSIQLLFLFGLITLLLLMGAILMGLLSSQRLAAPIGALIDAAEKISNGLFNTRVESTNDWGLGPLTNTFNRMTLRLQVQQKSLLQKNKTLEGHGQFIEAVLGGVASGVISIDTNGIVRTINHSALLILGGMTAKKAIGQSLKKVFPEGAAAFSTEDTAYLAVARDDADFQKQVQRSDRGKPIELMLRLVPIGVKQVDGYIMTVENITDLVRAQRQAAWSDVARRVAHEIKNPLTPIQLAAERLQKKFLPQIKQDPESFARCINTITRKVQHMGNMVREFSDFARLPTPQFQQTDLVMICKEALSLFEDTHPAIDFKMTTPLTLPFIADPEQIGQVLINLLSNSLEAIVEAQKLSRETNPSEDTHQDAIIHLTLSKVASYYKIEIQDTGPGFPPEHLHQLTEPYITHKAGGTGLGLAIVQKIVEDHKGTLALKNTKTGAAIEIHLKNDLEEPTIEIKN